MKLTGRGFECVVRALKSNRAMRRSNWEENMHIYLEDGEIKLSNSTGSWEYCPDSEDILANDWETLSG